MITRNNINLGAIALIFLTACASKNNNTVSVKKSYLETNNDKQVVVEVNNAELINNQALTLEEKAQQKKFRFVPPLKINTAQAHAAEDILIRFSEQKKLKITADDLPLQDYLHYVFGEQLKISYILAEDVKQDQQTVTLNLQKPITERKLFTLTEELLTQRSYSIRFDDNIFYIQKSTEESAKNNVVYGFGKNIADVPQTSLDIIQMVPFEYGMQTSMGNTLRQMLGIKAIPDSRRNSISIQGKRKDVIRALELIQILDAPNFKNRQIGIYQASFWTTQSLINKITELLAQEGILLSSGKSVGTTLSVIELDKQGELIFFANNIQVIERAVFWANKIDKPVLTAEEQYFIYQPNYSRAIDMGESLEPLISGASSTLSNTTSAAAENKNQGRRGITSAISPTMKMVVDERANALIFFTSGAEYQQILPLIKRLDILPRQVMLEVTIAEVTLTDTFKSGVEFVLTNGGAKKTGSFNVSSGAGGLSYVLSGTNGSVTATLLQSNLNVNVLSRPSLVVRDGVTANISVGDDIPTVGDIVTDPTNGSKTSVVYRKTGIDLKVKPTINARGIVIMEIDQKISNQATGDNSVAGSPVIFERQIGTEVIAQSGQTIVLGGLISENNTINRTRVPFFSAIPLIGGLFNSNNDEGGKTELVVLVTPKVLESDNEWQDIKKKFTQTMQSLIIEPENNH